MTNYYSYDTPLGPLTITANERGIMSVHTNSKHISEAEERETPLIKEAHRQLEEYFDGDRKKFDLPLFPAGTDFQKKVWELLLEIPYGSTRSYKDIATAAGNPAASRAVGLANNRNPIMIIIPCHRVVGSNGSLTGYAGGLDKKEYLLMLEQGTRKLL